MKTHLAAAGIALLALPALAAAETINVPADYLTIAGALAVAAPGDTVLVACGEYLERELQMASGVVLRGESEDPECTVINAQHAGRVMWVVDCDAGTRIEQLTLVAGQVLFEGVPPPDQRAGAGLFIQNSTVTIQRAKIWANDTAHDYCNSFGMGAGVYCEYSNVVFEDVLFDSNVTRAGGGAFCTNSTAVFRNVRFLENGAWSDYYCGGPTRGGALNCIECEGLILEDVIFELNYATGYESQGYGGAFHCLNSSGTLTRVAFLRNLVDGSLAGGGSG